MNLDKKENIILNNLNVNNIAENKESKNKQKEISGLKQELKTKRKKVTEFKIINRKKKN